MKKNKQKKPANLNFYLAMILAKSATLNSYTHSTGNFNIMMHVVLRAP